MFKLLTSFLLGAALTIAVTSFAGGFGQRSHEHSQASQPMMGGAEYEDGYTMQVINLINVATQIHNGKAKQLESSIEQSIPDYLKAMEKFRKGPEKTAAFYASDKLFQATGMKMPADLAQPIGLAKQDAKQVLSKDCYKEILCIPGPGCVKWPTSLHPVDVNKLDPMGWHYIVGSHCGFHWPKIWKLECGEPIGLTACTGD